jgi:hypothetical protein
MAKKSVARRAPNNRWGAFDLKGHGFSRAQTADEPHHFWWGLFFPSCSGGFGWLGDQIAVLAALGDTCVHQRQKR